MSKRCDRFSLGQAILSYVSIQLMRAGAVGIVLLGLLGLGEATVLTAKSEAQSIVEDGTAGTQVDAGPVFQGFPDGGFFITGGSISESNLFHSFETFSPDERYAIFDLRDASYNNISDVFARVTGSMSSSLNGYLEVVGGNRPSLFLLNPNGVILGPQATLRVPGSVFVSTAQSVLFEDGSAFAANSAEGMIDRPMLTVSAPVGVQFGENSSPIEVSGRYFSGRFNNRSERYTFSPGTTVTLLSSGLDIENSYFRTDPGNVRLGSVGDGAYVGIDADTAALVYAADTPLENLTVSNSVIDVDGVSDGDVQITGREVHLNKTVVLSATESAEDGGLVDITAEQVTLSNSSIRSIIYDERDNTRATADTKGGSINITAAESFVSQGVSQLLTDTRNAGSGGNITIKAEDISFLGVQETEGPPRFGNRLSAVTAREGQGGNITLIADSLLATGSTLIDASSYSSRDPAVQSGNGGTVSIEVGQLTLQDVSQIGSGTFGNGDSGDLTVIATRGIDVSGSYFPDDPLLETASSGIFVSAEPGSTGKGGNALIETPRLTIAQGGVLSARTAGEGDAGSMTIRASDISISGAVSGRDNGRSLITATVAASGSGSGGALNILSDRLHLLDGGQISASTNGTGNAGSVDIRSSAILVEGASANGLVLSEISSRSTTDADAGSVSLESDRITLLNKGTISVSNTAGGSAGNANLSANTIYLNQGNVQADAGAGEQGNLNFESRDFLLLREGSTITTNATETATGGNIFLNTPLIIGTENSDISANAVEGDGGNITLVTQGLIGIAARDQLTAGSDITATSELGVNGVVNIESPTIETDSGLVQLPENVIDASDQVAASCAVQDGNQFASTGRGGLPNNPLQRLSSNRPWQDFRRVATDSSVSPAQAAAPQSRSESFQLAEAGAWYVNGNGEVELMATNAVERLESNCLDQKVASH